MNQTASPVVVAPPAVKAAPAIPPSVTVATTAANLQLTLDAAIIDSMRLVRRCIARNQYGNAEMHLAECMRAVAILRAMKLEAA